MRDEPSPVTLPSSDFEASSSSEVVGPAEPTRAERSRGLAMGADGGNRGGVGAGGSGGNRQEPDEHALADDPPRNDHAVPRERENDVASDGVVRSTPPTLRSGPSAR